MVGCFGLWIGQFVRELVRRTFVLLIYIPPNLQYLFISNRNIKKNHVLTKNQAACGTYITKKKNVL
jgi:hypothetical protein